jgi:hypothetical protein
MINKSPPAVIVVLGIATLVALDWQSAPERVVEPLHYRGELRAADGQPIMGAHVIGVELWDAAERGKRLCSVQAQSIAVDRGQFKVLLSDACTGELARGRAAWADLEVDGERLSPRAQLMSRQVGGTEGVRGDSVTPVGSETAPALPHADGAAESPSEADSVSAPRESNFRI